MRHDELAERLEALAATVSPDPEAMQRIRGGLVTEARRRSARAGQPRFGVLGAAWLAGTRAIQPAADRLRTQRWGGPRPFAFAQRLAFAAGTAALVLSFSTGLAAASAPGAPLYGTRLWLESITLPASGSARAHSEIALLESRLSEAREAAARQDRNALEAALAAYQDTAEDAARNAGANDKDLDDTLAKHVAVLQGLLGTTGGKSQAALQRAIDNAERNIDRLEGDTRGNANGGGQGAGDGSGGGSGSGSGGGQGAGDGGNGDNGGGARNTPPPRPTPNPHPTPKGGKP